MGKKQDASMAGKDGRRKRARVACGHTPVMRSEVRAMLAPAQGEIFLDATFGAGGHTRDLLDIAGVSVTGLDRDPLAQQHAAALKKNPELQQGRFSFAQGCFSTLATLAEQTPKGGFDGILFDLGISSMQVDMPKRGFSFLEDGPLDMRMGTSDLCAADILASYSEAELCRILRAYGEEPRAARMARLIIEARKHGRLRGTRDLAALAGRAKPGYHARHPATRLFQALRMAVNDELGELHKGLHAAERALLEGGRLVVISYHSLEDRMVKQFLRARMRPPLNPSRHAPVPASVDFSPRFKALHRGVIRPLAEEIRANPRGRSARLRAAMRTGIPASEASPDQ